ncbi:MAG: PAS domain S-box protein, partial [Anaerolineaceae bacterium]
MPAFRQSSEKPENTAANQAGVENLTAEEQRFKRLASLATEGLMVHRDGSILEANQAFAGMVGLSDPEALIGKNALEVIPLTPESRQCITDPIQTGAVKTYELTLKQSDGTTIPVEVTCRDIDYPDGTARLVTLWDISNRKQTELMLIRQLDRLNVLHTLEQAVASDMDLDAILRLFVRLIVEQIQVDACSILLLNPQTKTLDFAAKKGFLTHALEFTRLRLGVGLAGRAAKDQRVIFIPDLAEIKDNAALTKAIAKENFVMYIGIPLI